MASENTSKPTTTTTTEHLVVDILSVGSQTQPQLQDAQQATFGSHPQVRHFYRATEADDRETDCSARLTQAHVTKVARFCRQEIPRHFSNNNNKDKNFGLLRKLADFFFSSSVLLRKSNPQGWLCAQKRPFDGFQNMRKQYYTPTTTPSENNNNNTDWWPRVQQLLPDYLFVVDDDTWVNLPLMLDRLQKDYQQEKAHAVAGCMIKTNEAILKFSLPFGGYGLMLNRKALERLLQPLYCSFGVSNRYDKNRTMTQSLIATQEQSEFAKSACWRLRRNGVGEQAFFRNEDSLADLMHAYATHHAYQDVEKTWQPTDPGFCLHSDWHWAYYVNFYGLADGTVSGAFRNTDRLSAIVDSVARPWKNRGIKAQNHTKEPLQGECAHGNDLGQTGPNGNQHCQPNAHVCHRITPSHMRYLHNVTTNNMRVQLL